MAWAWPSIVPRTVLTEMEGQAQAVMLLNGRISETFNALLLSWAVGNLNYRPVPTMRQTMDDRAKQTRLGARMPSDQAARRRRAAAMVAGQPCARFGRLPDRVSPGRAARDGGCEPRRLNRIANSSGATNAPLPS
jgi:hypothetical protein